MQETFQPVALGAPSTFLGKLKINCRLALGLQVNIVDSSSLQSAEAFSDTLPNVKSGTFIVATAFTSLFALLGGPRQRSIVLSIGSSDNPNSDLVFAMT